MKKVFIKVAVCILLLIVVFQIKNKLTTKVETPKDTIVFAWDAVPRSIDPRFVIDANSQYLEDLVHCSLFTYNEKGILTASLAKFYAWKDPMHLNVEIKEGMKFWNGTKLEIEDVARTYQFFLKKEATGAPRKGAYKNLKSVNVLGKNILEFVLNKPEAAFVNNLVVGILPTHLADSARITEVKDLMGCGAFKIKQMDSYKIDLVRNENYTLEEVKKNEIQKLQIKVVKQESTRFAKLIKGELDLVQNGISAGKLAMIKEEHKGLEISKRAGLNVTYLGFNFKDKLTGNRAIREAVSLAIDRESIIEHVLKGNATLATTMLTPDDPYLLKSLKLISTDLEQAKNILDEAGFKDPDGEGPKKRFKLTYKTTNNATRLVIAKAIASQLAQVGIEVEVLPLEWGKFKKDVEDGNVQLWSLSWVGFKDPNIYNYTFASEHFPPNGGNRGRYRNPQLDKLLAQAEALTAVNDRKAIYYQVQEIVAQDLPYVFLWHEDLVAVMSKRVKNFKVFADGRLQGLLKAVKN